MAHDPHPPHMQSTRVHAGDGELCRAIAILTAGALGGLYMIGWFITDLFNPGCTGNGDPTAGWHSGTQCAQQNYGPLALFLTFAVVAILYSLTGGSNVSRCAPTASTAPECSSASTSPGLTSPRSRPSWSTPTAAASKESSRPTPAWTNSGASSHTTAPAPATTAPR